jgi:hypothetical protein
LFDGQIGGVGATSERNGRSRRQQIVFSEFHSIALADPRIFCIEFVLLTSNLFHYLHIKGLAAVAGMQQPSKMWQIDSKLLYLQANQYGKLAEA